MLYIFFKLYYSASPYELKTKKCPRRQRAEHTEERRHQSSHNVAVRVAHKVLMLYDMCICDALLHIAKNFSSTEEWGKCVIHLFAYRLWLAIEASILLNIFLFVRMRGVNGGGWRNGDGATMLFVTMCIHFLPSSTDRHRSVIDVLHTYVVCGGDAVTRTRAKTDTYIVHTVKAAGVGDDGGCSTFIMPQHPHNNRRCYFFFSCFSCVCSVLF